MTKIICPHILSAIFVIVCRTKCTFKLELELDGSHPYMKFGRNRVINREY